MKKLLIATLSFALLCITPLPSRAVYGGTLAIGDSRVVTYFHGRNSNGPGCSGTLINPQVVVTAAHCLGNEGGIFPSEVFYPDDLWVAQPGVNIHSDDLSTRVQVREAVLTAGYDNTWDPAHGNVNTTIDDVTFLFLDKPLVDTYSIPIATSSDLEFIKSSLTLMTEIGYGLQDQNYFNGSPYLATLEAMPYGSGLIDTKPYESVTIGTVETGDVAMCPGDSGSPYFATINGVEKLVAVLTGASGCRGAGSGTGGTRGTLIEPYLPLLNRHFNDFLTNLPLIRSNFGAIDFSLPHIQVPFGCHPQTSSMLQVYEGGVWVDYLSAQGWALVSGCPRSNPFQAWVHADLATGTFIRWHVWSGNIWSWTSDPESFVNPNSPIAQTPIERVLTVPTDSGGVPVPTPTPAAAPIETPVTSATSAPVTGVKNLNKCLSLKFKNEHSCRNQEEKESRKNLSE